MGKARKTPPAPKTNQWNVMKKLLSVVIAAAFAATTVTAFAQATKDVKAKDGKV